MVVCLLEHKFHDDLIVQANCSLLSKKGFLVHYLYYTFHMVIVTAHVVYGWLVNFGFPETGNFIAVIETRNICDQCMLDDYFVLHSHIDNILTVCTDPAYKN